MSEIGSNNRILAMVLSAALSVVVLVTVTLFVAWLFEDIIYFSLFIGIPCGLFAALIVFVVVFHYLTH